jgi:hypothetical protein
MFATLLKQYRLDTKGRQIYLETNAISAFYVVAKKSGRESCLQFCMEQKK